MLLGPSKAISAARVISFNRVVTQDPLPQKRSPFSQAGRLKRTFDHQNQNKIKEKPQF